jgi:hypothetical protein
MPLNRIVSLVPSLSETLFACRRFLAKSLSGTCCTLPRFYALRTPRRGQSFLRVSYVIVTVGKDLDGRKYWTGVIARIPTSVAKPRCLAAYL